MLRRVLRFSLVGLLATAIHVAVASILIIHFHALPAWANGFAFLVATCSSLIFNTYWSFSSRLDAQVARRYVLVSAVGFLFSSGISHAVDLTGVHYLWGIFAVVCIMPFINFLMHQFWTYRVKISGEPSYE